MSTISQVVFFSLIGGVFSLVGGFLLLANKKRAKMLAKYATPFAAGALLAAAFTDLLKEAAHQGSIDMALIFALVGILTFFLLERFLHWFHHHHEDESRSKTDPTASLIIIGDTLHNFIDGIAIAAGFLVSPSTGIVVTLAVAAHEIPQEIGDFGLLLQKGMSRKKVILANIFSALSTTVAAVIFFTFGSIVNLPFDIVLGLVAGLFIYIAASDIIPSIHRNEEKNLVGLQTVLLIVGVIVVSITTNLLHGAIEVDSHTEEQGEHESDHSEEEDNHHEEEPEDDSGHDH